MEQSILRFFESIRCTPLTVFFGFFSAFGETVVVAACLILVYWLSSRRTGEQIAVAALTSIPLNAALKLVVSRPRPFVKGVVRPLTVDMPLLSTTAESLGANMSFPSGHAQMTGNFLCSCAARAKKLALYIAAPLFVLLVMCSRLYFGVHYPSDLLAGLALGVAVALFWELVYRRFPGARYFILCGLALLGLVPLLFFTHKDYQQAAGLLAGAALCLPLCDMLVRCDPAPFPRRLWRIPLGLLPAGAAFALTLLFPEVVGLRVLKWLLIAAAATLGAHSLFKLCKV